MNSTVNINTKIRRQANASMEQKRLLLEFMKENPKLTTGKFSNDFSLKDAQRLWEYITKILNSCGGGACKDWRSWRKTWHDIRSRTKTSQFKNYQRGTGGGPYHGNPTTEYESEVLETIKLVSIEGDTNVMESMTDFSFETSEQIGAVELNSDSVFENRVEKENDLNTNELIPEETKTSEVFKRKVPRASRKKFIYASEAAESYKASLEEKNKIKSEYFNKKIIILERMVIAKEKSAVSKEKSAAAKERTACALEEIATSLKDFVTAIS